MRTIKSICLGAAVAVLLAGCSTDPGAVGGAGPLGGMSSGANSGVDVNGPGAVTPAPGNPDIGPGSVPRWLGSGPSTMRGPSGRSAGSAAGAPSLEVR